MALVNHLKENYSYQEVVQLSEHLIQTEYGHKRIEYWDEFDLLEWHVAWRDTCQQPPHVFVDRMIRTKDGRTAIPYEHQWITVHDHMEGAVPLQLEENREAIWGAFIGNMLAFGEQTPYSASTQERLIAPSSVGTGGQWAALVREGKKRIQQSEQLTAWFSKLEPPTLPASLSIDRGYSWNGLFFFCPRKEEPQKSYAPLRTFLLFWMEEYGTDSLKRLLDEMDDFHPLTDGQGYLLLAECLKPYELQGVREGKDVRKEWEKARKLVRELSGWLDEKKKVSDYATSSTTS